MKRLLISVPGDPLALARALVPLATEVTHAFEPHGLSVVRLGAMATVALHTWPEVQRATLDCYGVTVTTLDNCLERAGVRVFEEVSPSEDSWNSCMS